MNVDEKGIMEMLGQKISEYEQKIRSLRDAIGALVTGEHMPSSSAPAKTRRGRRRGRKAQIVILKKVQAVKASQAKGAPRQTRRPRSGETLEGWILKQFSDNKPKTNRTLMELYNKSTGKKLDANGFSARLAMIKKRGHIRSAKNNADGLLYNGKAEWFENGKFRKEYGK
jgi:hypothetical protein